MPFISTALAVAGIAAAGAGVGSSVAGSSAASKGQAEQNAIAQQEQNNRNQAFQQAESFYTPYTKQGSPFLSNIQAQGAGQTAQQFGNAAGQLRESMQTSGMGYGPSGTTGAALGQLGQQAAQGSAQNYLQNLLNNEQLKFQAQQGITNAANGPQLTPNSTIVPNQTGSSVNAFGQAVGNLANQNSSTPLTPNVGQIPFLSAANPDSAQNFNAANPFGVPTTQGTDV